MKLSISFNFFNGEEHLLHSIKNIRPVCDHLSIVYQSISNHGNQISPVALAVLNKIKELGLADDIIFFEPDLEVHPSINEFRKRSIGANLAKKKGYTHFLSMDSDEFYIQSEFEKAKAFIVKNNVTYSVVSSFFYLHKPIWRSALPDNTCVSFISKLDDQWVHKRAGYFPKDFVDPTRRFTNKNGNFKVFDVGAISMHHMNFVRSDNFKSKLTNSTNASNTTFMEKVSFALGSWEFGSDFNFPNKDTYQIIEVKNNFKLPFL